MQAEDSGDDAVYGVGNEENDSFYDDEEYEAEALSDLEEEKNDDDDLPNIRAWGKEKKNFYSTDYVDKDFGGFQGKDAEMAEMEEKEAETLQQQLLQRMQDEDFSIPPSGKRSTDERKSTQSKKLKRGTIVTDESNLLLKMIRDNEEKMKMLNKQSDREQIIIEPSKKKKKKEEKKKMEGLIKNCRAPSNYHEKRPITYEMAKNKGLTPHKKDARNPRIVLRKRHRKAVIRRKGAIRAPRTESVRYSGEASGIKISVSKSVKIRT